MYKTYAEVSGRLSNGLVSWWALELSSLYTDSTGTNDGTNAGSTQSGYDTLYGGNTPVIPRAIDNAPTVQADAIGAGSASLNGSAEYIVISDDSSLDLTSDISISAWVFFSSFDHDQGGIVAKAGNSGDGYGLYSDKGGSTSVGTAKFYSNTYDASVATSGTLSINKWYYMTGVHDGSASTSKIYIDGVLIDTQTSASSSVANSDNLHIGRIFGGSESYDHNGNICQVGIWDEALTQAQIQSIMEKTYEELTASEKTNLVSYWALDETVEASGDGAKLVHDKVDETLSELSPNYSCDDNITGWSGYVSSVSHETTITYGSSSGSLKSEPNGGNDWIAKSTSDIGGLSAGNIVKATAKVYIPSGWDGGDIWFQGSSWDSRAEWYTKASASTTDEWQDMIYYAQLDADVAGPMFIRGSATISAGMVIYFDNISIKVYNGNVGRLI
jgi:hypothetical protein